MKIVILDGYTENPGDLSWDGFSAFGETAVYDRTEGGEAETVARIRGAEIVLTNKTPITRAVIEQSPDLRYIGVLATGYNIVDTNAAAERGIPVTNAPSYATGATAQYAIALLLEICSRAGAHDAAVHAGRWAGSADFSFTVAPLTELEGKTIGIIGFGRIGRAVGTIAKAMGMRVLAHSPHERPEGRAIGEYVPLDTLLAESDVVSLHCPLFPGTERIINRETLGKMKDGAILINNGRGGLLDEAAVAAALESGKLAAAGVDVLSTEPPAPDNPLLHAKNCVITPHVSWAAKESRARLMDISVENVAAFLAGRPQNVVNGV